MILSSAGENFSCTLFPRNQLENIRYLISYFQIEKEMVEVFKYASNDKALAFNLVYIG